ncbi:hypothetical protein E2542_SST12669 [Spatholobus suberectus]|nr:hypothetical protein E2542_SST12669 [Spatholobus suberectus]
MLSLGAYTAISQRNLLQGLATTLADDLQIMLTAFVLAVVLMGGFAHKTLCQVACKILPAKTAVAAVLVECQALITLLQHKGQRRWRW